MREALFITAAGLLMTLLGIGCFAFADKYVDWFARPFYGWLYLRAGAKGVILHLRVFGAAFATLGLLVTAMGGLRLIGLERGAYYIGSVLPVVAATCVFAYLVVLITIVLFPHKDER